MEGTGWAFNPGQVGGQKYLKVGAVRRTEDQGTFFLRRLTEERGVARAGGDAEEASI